MDFDMYDINYVFWVKFVICFGLFVIVPVWIWAFVELGFLMRVMFTFAGAVGVALALGGKTIKYGKNRYD